MIVASYAYWLKISGEDGVVVKVIDGDTFELAGGRRVRLIGIDAPEKGECYHTESSQYLSKLIEGKSVVLIEDQEKTDRFGRSLYYVYLDDVFINEKMAEDGAVVVKKYPPNTMMQLTLERAEGESKKSNLGLWGKCPQKGASMK